jgi:hypothetical protein
MQTLSKLCTEVRNSQKDDLDDTKQIGNVKRDLNTTEGTIRQLQKMALYTPSLQTIELLHPLKFLGDYKELLNFISKLHSTLTRANTRLTDDQHKLHYLCSYFEGNIQNHLHTYVHTHKIELLDIESLIDIIEATFGDLDKVGAACTECYEVTWGC